MSEIPSHPTAEVCIIDQIALETHECLRERIQGLEDNELDILFQYFLKRNGVKNLPHILEDTLNRLLEKFDLSHIVFNQGKQRLFAFIYTEIVRRHIDNLSLDETSIGLARLTTELPGERIPLSINQVTDQESGSSKYHYLESKEGYRVGEVFYGEESNFEFDTDLVITQNLKGESGVEGCCKFIDFLKKTYSNLPATLNLNAINKESIPQLQELGYDVAFSQIVQNSKTNLGNAVAFRTGTINSETQYSWVAPQSLNPHHEGLLHKDYKEGDELRGISSYGQLLIEQTNELYSPYYGSPFEDPSQRYFSFLNFVEHVSTLGSGKNIYIGGHFNTVNGMGGFSEFYTPLYLNTLLGNIAGVPLGLDGFSSAERLVQHILETHNLNLSYLDKSTKTFRLLGVPVSRRNDSAFIYGSIEAFSGFNINGLDHPGFEHRKSQTLSYLPNPDIKAFTEAELLSHVQEEKKWNLFFSIVPPALLVILTYTGISLNRSSFNPTLWIRPAEERLKE